MSLCSQSSNKTQYPFQSFVFGAKDLEWGITSASAGQITFVDSRGNKIPASVKNLVYPLFFSILRLYKMKTWVDW